MPALLRAWAAAASVWPETSGMVAFSGCAGVVAAVVVAVVVEVVDELRVATESVTTDPFRRLARGFGTWSMTVPAGRSLVAFVVATCRPSFSRAARASASGLPVMSGTAIVAGGGPARLVVVVGVAVED